MGLIFCSKVADNGRYYRPIISVSLADYRYRPISIFVLSVVHYLETGFNQTWKIIARAEWVPFRHNSLQHLFLCWKNYVKWRDIQSTFDEVAIWEMDFFFFIKIFFSIRKMIAFPFNETIFSPNWKNPKIILRPRDTTKVFYSEKYIRDVAFHLTIYGKAWMLLCKIKFLLQSQISVSNFAQCGKIKNSRSPKKYLVKSTF